MKCQACSWIALRDKIEILSATNPGLGGSLEPRCFSQSQDRLSLGEEISIFFVHSSPRVTAISPQVNLIAVSLIKMMQIISDLTYDRVKQGKRLTTSDGLLRRHGSINICLCSKDARRARNFGMFSLFAFGERFTRVRGATKILR